MEIKINEIFSSVQGEGPYVGYKQLFIRFCGCNLKCDYCDTEFAAGKVYSPQELYNIVESKLPYVHSVSLTGGEPLISYKFLKEFLPLIKNKTKIYLETNATMAKEFSQIKDLIDIVSADIKLPSASGFNSFDLHKDFLGQCHGIETFAKIVFDNKITDEEIKICTDVAKECDIEIILQPEMKDDKMVIDAQFTEKILDKFIDKYPKVRLIPQVHKFINVK